MPDLRQRWAAGVAEGNYRLICDPILEEGKTMSSVSHIHPARVNDVPSGAISRAEANEIVRNALNEFQNRATEPLVNLLCSGDGSGWLEAVAKALGDKLNKAADDLKYHAAHVNADNPGQTTELSAQASEFSTMMDAFNNVIKTMGEALDSMVRKQ